MSETYNTLEGDYSVQGSDSAVRAGTTNAVALVGGYDAANAASGVTAGEVTKITDPTNAETEFGTSELSRAAAVVADNGVGEVYGAPVSETSTTESFASSQSLTLSNSPIFDPQVHPDHSLTITDTVASTDLTINYVYDGSPATPSESDTANVNPLTGEIKTDASSDYDVSYTYGTYSTAIENAVREDVRYIVVLSEADAHGSKLATELGDVASDFEFKRGVVGARPEIAAGSISSYSPSTNDWRLIEVAPARANVSAGPVRTAAAVGGFMATQPIGPDGSGLYDDISGVESLNTQYRPSEIKDFSQVTAIDRSGTIGVAETTSSTTQFQSIYATEIIDDVGSDLFGTARNYAGGPQDPGELKTLLNTDCQAAAQGNPPLLGSARSDVTPYDVSVSLDPNDSSIANASVTILPYPIAEEVNLDLTVSDGFVQFEGAN